MDLYNTVCHVISVGPGLPNKLGTGMPGCDQRSRLSKWSRDSSNLGGTLSRVGLYDPNWPIGATVDFAQFFDLWVPDETGILT